MNAPSTALSKPTRVQAFMMEVIPPDRREEVFTGLPSHVKPERFERGLSNALMDEPKILQCNPREVFREVVRIVSLGLVLDRHLGEAYLIADHRGGVQARIGYRGIIKLARQSGEIDVIAADEVCRNDRFSVVKGTERKLIHEVDYREDRGEVFAYAAVVIFRGGAADFEVMALADIHRIRDRTDAYRAFKAGKIKSTPWATDEGEMAKKTVLRRVLKRCPQSPDLAEALRYEDAFDAKEEIAPALSVSPAMARLAAARAPQTADTGRQIIEHTEREIAATQGATAHEDDFNNDITDIEPAGTAGYNDGEPEAGGEADGNGAEGSRLAPEQLDVLERLSAALFRATSKAGLATYAGHFWGENGGAPEKGSPMHDAAGRVWRQHEARVTGGVDAEGCRTAVDQIIGGMA